MIFYMEDDSNHPGNPKLPITLQHLLISLEEGNYPLLFPDFQDGVGYYYPP